MIKVVLWDIDGTLLDFHQAERAAIRALFQKFNLGVCTDEMLAHYSSINAGYWRRLETGELTKPQVLTGRFQEFFSIYGLDTGCVEDFNAAYQLALGDTVCFYPNALETLTALKDKVLQCAVTNGTAIAQKKKLAVSGLDQIFDHIFISDEIGIDKPNLAFFHAVWKKIGDFAPEEVLIVGDSLTSDIRGGNNAGILTCWFNPKDLPCPNDLRIDYRIRDIGQITEICNTI